MVKMNEIPEEKPSVDLSKLPTDNILMATEETFVEAVQGAKPKTAGLVVTFKTKEGETFKQKYSKRSGSALKAALEKLGYEGTEPLFKKWHNYRQIQVSQGFPRYVPVSVVK